MRFTHETSVVIYHVASFTPLRLHGVFLSSQHVYQILCQYWDVVSNNRKHRSSMTSVAPQRPGPAPRILRGATTRARELTNATVGVPSGVSSSVPSEVFA
jgi:hypothetical protein